MKTSYHKVMEEKDIETVRQICETLPDYVSKYIRSIQYNTTAKTRLEYVSDLKNFFEYMIETLNEPEMKTCKDITLLRLETLDKDFFEEYLDYMQKYEKNGKVYTNGIASIKRKLSSLRNFFQYLFLNELVMTNSVLKVRMPKLREKEIIRMDADETERFIDSVEYGMNMSAKQHQYHDKQKVRDLAIICLMLSTGIRVSECVGLDMADVDLQNSCLKIIRKGGKEAMVYFSDEASGYLMEYIEERKRTETMEGHENALFLSSRRKRISVRSIETLVKKYAQQAVPLKHITPHKLRSTFGTALYEETSDIYLVAEALGHNDISTTKKHYANLSNSRKAENRNKVSLRKN